MAICYNSIKTKRQQPINKAREEELRAIENAKHRPVKIPFWLRVKMLFKNSGDKR